MKVIFGTTNERKVEDLNLIIKRNNLDIEVLSLKNIGFLEEIEENGLSIQENSLIKANAILEFCREKNINYPIITDDSGLFIDSLNGEPGIYTARYGDDEIEQDPSLPKWQSINKILRKMEGVEDRKASFHCCVTILNNDGKCIQVNEKTDGCISDKIIEPLKKPWSYCVFVVEKFNKTLHQLTPEETYETYRAKALEKALIILGANKVKELNK